jgi:hypothetical protein
MSKEYTIVAELVAAEAGSKGHVLRSGGYEIGGQDVPISYRLEDVSSPTGGVRKDVVGWFDGKNVSPINNA